MTNPNLKYCSLVECINCKASVKRLYARQMQNDLKKFMCMSCIMPTKKSNP